MTRKKDKTVKFTSRDWNIELKCEWDQCKVTSQSMKHFTDHVTQHINESTVINAEEATASDLQCRWCDCMHAIEGGVQEFKRHVFFHAFHAKLKSLGMSYLVKANLSACEMGANNRNIIPDLPEQFHCGWSNCEIVCDNPEFFYNHVKTHSEDYPAGKKIKVACKCLWQGCDASFKTRYLLQEHLHSHTQEKVIACPTCGNLFSSMSKFKDHLLRQDETLKTYQCSHCKKCYQNERLLRDHMRKHVSNYKCPFCEMTVAAPSQLRMHIRYRHMDDREFQCKACDKGFKTERDIERHERSCHMNVTMNCPQDACSFKCKHQFQLDAHIKAHNKDNPTLFVCHICSATYRRGRTLTVHLMRHHGFRWMPGHRKFKYNLTEDGTYRLQTVRYESFELSQQQREEDLRKTLNGSKSRKHASTSLARDISNCATSAANIAGSSALETTTEESKQTTLHSTGSELNSVPISDDACEAATYSDMPIISASTPLDLSAKKREIRKSPRNSSKGIISPKTRSALVAKICSRSKKAVKKTQSLTVSSKKPTRKSARKSLEETLENLRNSPKKKPNILANAKPVHQESSQTENKGKTIRNRKRKNDSCKKGSVAKKRKTKTSEVDQEGPSGENLTTSCEQVGDISPGQSHMCCLESADGGLVMVETNVPLILSTLQQGDGQDLPEGATLIACGDQ